MSREEFIEVKVLKESQEGVAIAPITVRTAIDGSKRMTFSLMREFVKESASSRTCWFQKKHIASMRRLLDEVDKFLTVEEERLKMDRKAKKRTS